MKKDILVLLILVNISCVPNQNKENNDRKEMTSVSDGTIILSTRKKIKETLINEFELYLYAMLTGDIDKSVQYTHDIGIEQLKKNFPNEKNIYSIKRKLKEIFFSGVDEMNRELNMKFETGKVINIVSYDDNYMCIVSYTKSGSNGIDKIDFNSYVIAISTEYGMKWKFLEYDQTKTEKYIEALIKYYPKDIVDDLFYGIISEEESSFDEIHLKVNEKEKLLISQFVDYSDAYFSGDVDLVMSYLYSGLFEYLRLEYPNEYSAENIKEIFIEEKLLKIPEEYDGYLIRVNVREILSKIKYGNELLYLIKYTVDINNTYEKFSFGGESVAISIDDGNSWRFFEVNQEECENILSINYPSYLIKELLSYSQIMSLQ